MTDDDNDTAHVRQAKYGHLPPLVVESNTSQEIEPARDPEAGRDTDRDFMFRHMSG